MLVTLYLGVLPWPYMSMSKQSSSSLPYRPSFDMHLKIQLDSPDITYTNGDILSGHIVLHYSPGTRGGSLDVHLEGRSTSATITKTGLFRELRESHQVV